MGAITSFGELSRQICSGQVEQSLETTWSIRLFQTRNGLIFGLSYSLPWIGFLLGQRDPIERSLICCFLGLHLRRTPHGLLRPRWPPLTAGGAALKSRRGRLLCVGGNGQQADNNNDRDARSHSSRPSSGGHLSPANQSRLEVPDHVSGEQ